MYPKATRKQGATDGAHLGGLVGEADALVLLPPLHGGHRPLEGHEEARRHGTGWPLSPVRGPLNQSSTVNRPRKFMWL